ncbi:prolyl hydroxylase family protein [Paraburkholderia hayleyella]|uniref:prolyl hydroxylase family protein n=1 Tax=Paraburkholderia hayleyella TaxID=2152889 RepID=UPI001292275C|nr:2OG-Fe(II) oxygenase [Paraburkholderia hayleyella]
MKTIDAAWCEWLATNIKRGCTMQSMVVSMVQAGFNQEDAAEAVRDAVAHERSSRPVSAPVDSEVARLAAAVTNATNATNATATTTASAANASITSSSLIAAGNVIRAYDRDIKVVSRHSDPSVIVFADVLTPDECNEVIARSAGRLMPSTVVNFEDGGLDRIDRRTSENFWFSLAEDELIERLERRMAALMNWPIENGEGLQVVRYGVGAEYQPHFDYFPPEFPGSEVFLERGGQRVATLLIYLNDVEEGGETVFPPIGLSVVPRQGGAVYFHYLNEKLELDPQTLHGGAPVIRGVKWIMTKWIRERPFV